MTTDRVSKASTAAEVSDEGNGENGRDEGGSDSDVESDGENVRLLSVPSV